MAEALRLDQVAEGIEEQDQLTFLRDHQCKYGQGYIFSHPVPPEQIPALRVCALV